MSMTYDVAAMDPYVDVDGNILMEVERAVTFAAPLVQDASGGYTSQVLVSFYYSATDTEEIAYSAGVFVGRYLTSGSTTDATTFVIRRRGGWPTGTAELRVREIIELAQAS